MSDFTIGAGIGPFLVGIAHSDYTAAEVEAWIEQTQSWNEGDLIGQEIAKRKIRIVGTFHNFGDAATTFTLNDGKPIATKLGWILIQSQQLSLWAYNLGTAAVATTVPTVNVQGHVNLFPQ